MVGPELGWDQHGDVPVNHLLGGKLENGDHVGVGLLNDGAVVDYE